jgi:hypothetical protein
MTMADSFTGQKFRVMALSAQAERAVDVERACRGRLGTRTRSVVSRGKFIAIAAAAGFVAVAAIRHRRKKHRGEDDAEAESASQERGILAKAGMAILLAQRINSLAGPFLRGMQWASQRDGRTPAREPEAAGTGE